MKNVFNEANPQAVMDHLAGVASADYDYDNDGIPRVQQGARIPYSAAPSTRWADASRGPHTSAARPRRAR
mgnify:FL=1|jgi:hypothetical protein